MPFERLENLGQTIELTVLFFKRRANHVTVIGHDCKSFECVHFSISILQGFRHNVCHFLVFQKCFSAQGAVKIIIEFSKPATLFLIDLVGRKFFDPICFFRQFLKSFFWKRIRKPKCDEVGRARNLNMR